MGMEATDAGIGFIIVTKFEKKMKEGSGKIGPDGKIAVVEYEHQPVLLNAAHIVAVEKVTLIDRVDKMSMATCTLIKMFGQSDVPILETLDEIADLLAKAGFAVRDARVK